MELVIEEVGMVSEIGRPSKPRSGKTCLIHLNHIGAETRERLEERFSVDLVRLKWSKEDSSIVTRVHLVLEKW